jgi:hypothetical protein
MQIRLRTQISGLRSKKETQEDEAIVLGLTLGAGTLKWQ